MAVYKAQPLLTTTHNHSQPLLTTTYNHSQPAQPLLTTTHNNHSQPLTTTHNQHCLTAAASTCANLPPPVDVQKSIDAVHVFLQKLLQEEQELQLQELQVEQELQELQLQEEELQQVEQELQEL
eukprot:gene8276-850_t